VKQKSTPHSCLPRPVASRNQTQPKKTNTQTVQKRRVFFPGCCAQIISSTVAAFQQVAIGVHHQEHERLSHPLPRTASPHSISQSHTAPRSFSTRIPHKAARCRNTTSSRNIAWKTDTRRNIYFAKNSCRSAGKTGAIRPQIHPRRARHERDGQSSRPARALRNTSRQQLPSTSAAATHPPNSLSAQLLRRQPRQHRPGPQQCSASNTAREKEERGVESERDGGEGRC